MFRIPSNLSIRRRLLLLLGAMVLLFTPVATTAFVIMEQKNSCSILLKSVTTYADIAAHSVAADLDFPWGSGPSGALTSLEPNKNIRMACVWDKDGRFFLGYPANYPKTSFPQTLPKADSHRFTSNSLEVFRVIKRHDRPVGMIYLQSNLDEIHDRLWTDAKIVVIVFMLLVLFASITAQFMHRHIAEPLLELSQAAQEVSEGKDYSMRLAKKMGGEIGTLTDSLNEMLAQIQSRDMRLTDYQNHLEDQVSQRSEQLIKANSQLLLSKEKAEEANRAKSTFLANMSHELRTPLNAILLYSELLADDLQEREIAELLPDIGKIQSSGKHLLSLIDEILDLSKIEAGRMTVFLEDCDLVALFKEIDATIGPLAARNNNRVIMDLDENLPSIRTDARMLRQVLYNLLNNAAKFTQGGEIHMKAFAEWSWGVFQVADTGIGMSEAQVRKIFREFTQGDESTTRRFGGTGLGLSLCRKLATLMGGELTVVSELEKGSTFTLRLPLSTPITTPLEVSRFITPAAPKPLIKVALVDRNPASRDVLAKAFMEEGCWTSQMDSIVEARESLQKVRPDLIVFRLDDLDSWKALTLCRDECSSLNGTSMILVAADESLSGGSAVFAADYLYKPMEGDCLMKALHRFGDPIPDKPVLVLESDPLRLEAMRSLLENEGWEVRTALNSAQAMEHLQLELPGLVIMNLMLPGLESFQFASYLHRSPGLQDLQLLALAPSDLSEEEFARFRSPSAEPPDGTTEDFLRSLGALARRALNRRTAP